MNKSEEIIKYVSENPNADVIEIEKAVGGGGCTGILRTLSDTGILIRNKEKRLISNGKTRMVFTYKAVPDAMQMKIPMIDPVVDTSYSTLKLPVIDVPQYDIRKESVAAKPSINLEDYSLRELRSVYKELHQMFGGANAVS